MKIQLLLANQEVELTKKVQIPLNKSFQNTTNPTDIIVDYSKSISIPMTTTNNRILGNAYRLDKNVISNEGNDNIGMYLDPTKKIPFTLLYNGELLMEGYAKFVSANYSATNKFYTMNLFSLLGDYFQKMKDVVVSQDKLTDAQKESGEGLKYVLNDHLGHTSLNSSYVKDSWLNINNNANDFSDSSIKDQDIVGFAPAYRGFYGLDFKANKVQVNDDEIMSLSDLLKDEWRGTYCLKNFGKLYMDCTDVQKQQAEEYASNLGADTTIGDGMKDYQMDEYRSYHQLPYIYINKLIYMFKEKSKELTGYDLELDSSWFNSNNPYWTKLIYTLNYLENIEELPSNTGEFPLTMEPMTLRKTPINECFGESKMSFAFTPHSSFFNITNIMSSVTFKLDNRVSKLKTYGFRWSEKTALVWAFTLTDANGNKQTKKLWSSSGDTIFVNPDNSYTPPNITSSDINVGWLLGISSNNTGNYSDYITSYYTLINSGLEFSIPEGMEDKEFTLDVEASLYSSMSSPLQIQVKPYYETNPYVSAWDYFDYISATVDAINFKYKTNESNSISLGLDLLYLDENPIFDVVLQYTKMFGLMWKMDDKNKKVKICRKSTYFKNYTIEDWSNKLDRSKDYVIEPITFESKYVNFNYEDVDGYKYSTYKDKYGVQYGTKKLKTSYEFDSNDKDLFSGIKPSLISQRKFIKYVDLRDWDLGSYIVSSTDIIPRIENEDKDNATAINESAWYFRNGNKSLSEPSFITDDSPLMINNKEYCWFTKAWLNELKDVVGFVQSISQIPLLSPVTNVDGMKYGCLFNCPNEDYTSDKSIKECNGRYIYDNIWSEYINERYSVNNKKLTAYFNIHPWEYMSFDFNKFVTIDNQLFMVNKIFDYDLNSTATTKCELVQVSDIGTYISDTIDFGGGLENEPEVPSELLQTNVTAVNMFVAKGSQQITISSNSTIDVNGIILNTTSQTSNGHCTLSIVSNGYNSTLKKYQCLLLLDWNFVSNGSYSGMITIEDLNSAIVIPVNIAVSDMGVPDKIASIGLARMDNNYNVSYNILIGNFAYDKVELALSVDGTDSGIVEYFDVTNELTGIIDNGLAGVPYLILYIDDIIYDIKEITNV